MKFTIARADHFNTNNVGDTVEIDTIEELQELSKRFDNKSLVVTFEDGNIFDKENVILIYDDYIE